MFFFTHLVGPEQGLWKALDCPPLEDTLANRVTILRGKLMLYVMPILYGIYVLAGSPLFLFAAIGLTVVCIALDGVDGKIAIHCNCESASGRCLDPSADTMTTVGGGFLVIAEFGTGREIVLPILGIACLAWIIFRKRRLDAMVRTHQFARIAIGTIYAGGIVFFAVMIAHALLPESGGLLNCENSALTCHWVWLAWFVGLPLGHGLLWLGFFLMSISTFMYYRSDIIRWYKRKKFIAKMKRLAY